MALRATLLLLVGLSLLISAAPAAAAIVVVDYDRTTYEGNFPSKPSAVGGQELGGGYGNDSYVIRAFSDTEAWSQNNVEDEPVLFGGAHGQAWHVSKTFDDYSLKSDRTLRYQTNGTTTYFAGTEDEVTEDQMGRLRLVFAFEAVSGGLSFDGDSSLAMSNSRFDSLGNVRWLVREGGTYYVSESTLSSSPSISGTDLLNEKWAVLDASAFLDDFATDAIGAFETRSFSDLDRFGFIADKTDFTQVRHWLGINTFQVVAVPEPATLALLGFGGLGVLPRKRR